MPDAGRSIPAVHWYSLTGPTMIVRRVGVTLVDAVQAPVPSTAPYSTVALVADWSVAKFTATCRPTRSVR